MKKVVVIIILLIFGCIVLYYSSNSLKKGVTMKEIGKEIEDYTYEEFTSLTSEEQMKFQSEFADTDVFDKWLNRVNDQEDEIIKDEEIPWNNGGKRVEEYTWNEFEELSGELQIQFQKDFEGDGFDKWLEVNEPKKE